jgi:regulator of replication initiation timing
VAQEIKRSLQATERNLGDSIDKLYERLDDSVKKTEELGKRLVECMEQISELKSENVTLRKKLSEVNDRCDSVDQKLLANEVEIYGIPSCENENLSVVVGKIGSELGVNITKECIDYVYRSKSKSNGSPGCIHVRFIRQCTKEDLLRKRRIKRNLSTRHLTLDSVPPSDEPVYINEALCPGRKKLFNAAREAKKTKKYAYLWVRNGKILMRKAEKEPVIVLTSFDQLNEL